MDIYKLKFTILQMEIFRLLCAFSGNKLNQRQIAKKLNVSPTAVAKSIPLLKKENLIIYEKQKNANVCLAELNRSSKKAMQLKRTENLKMLYESGLADFLEDFFPGSTIMLFGSYSRGDDNVTSDIDLAIIGYKEKAFDLKNFEKALNRKIILQFYDNLKNIHKSLKENICNGILITGGLEF